MGVGRSGLAEGGPGVKVGGVVVRGKRRGKKGGAAPVDIIIYQHFPGELPPAGYVLADALARSLPVPVASGVLAQLRHGEPGPREVRDAHAALLGAGFLLPGGELSAEGREAAREALALALG